ncbi:hypothetical protein GCM10011430_08300 [Oxalicibacterium solurbis]|uniref:Uncharacterized protein n=1 Tax=Oxalicibacterium solurbis TaxID=69280 RepID=A0A8J3F5L6_9BURK|nr:hypothetical protein GCM10011430_08300 [Oxalicibacterium solurbis]
MNEFDDGGQLMVRGALITVGIGHQQDQNGADAFAAGADDVVCNLVYQGYFRMELLPDNCINCAQIGGNGLN